jgi:tetratricopeptide (TPR) repeat protein
MEPVGDGEGGVPAGEPHDAKGYVARAADRLARGDWAGAVADCGEALKRDPQNVDAFLIRADARREQGYADRALADCHRALQVRPDDFRPYVLRGQIRVAQEKLDLAEQDFDQALAIDPRNADLYVRRAQVRGAKGDTGGALADCNQALEIDPRNGEAFRTRAAARWEQGDLNGGIRDCDEALQLDANDASAYLLRGNIRQMQGDQDGAGADFQESARLDASLGEKRPERSDAPGAEANILPLPTRRGPDEESRAALEEEEDEAIEQVGPQAIGGLRYWMIVGTIHGALAGVIFGIIPQTLAGSLALLVYAPLFAVLFLGRFLGGRRAAISGIALAAACIGGYLAGPDDRNVPLLWITEDNSLRIVCWLLAWGVLGALFLVFGGGVNIGYVIGLVKGGLPRALGWAKGGAVLGALVGAALWGLYELEPFEATGGGVVGAVAGLVVGAAAGNIPGTIATALLGAGLGAAAGAADLKDFYRVVGGGLGASLYWTTTAALVGLFVGLSGGARAAPRILAGPLYERVFAKNPLMAGRELSLGIGLMVGGAGVFMGASIGMTTGALFGGIPELAAKYEGETVAGLPPMTWAGGLLGLLLAFLYIVPIVARPKSVGFDEAVRPGLHWPVLTCVIGAGAGMVLAALAWSVDLALGGVAYWALVGAITGGILAAKLWSVAEK